MTTRWITWLAVCVALTATVGAATELRNHAFEAWQDTQQEVGKGMHIYFERQFRISAF